MIRISLRFPGAGERGDANGYSEYQYAYPGHLC